MPTAREGSFEWDTDKAEQNAAKHGVSFEEAITVIEAPGVQIYDDGSSSGRLLALGFSLRGRLLAVIYVERGELDRIVSAREATRAEESLYVKGESV
ncbi:MAG: BrnT family toxin [Polyangiaceae bacterium]|nr:BrnT family toxin [Polyangiaceae bacterium]